MAESNLKYVQAWSCTTACNKDAQLIIRCNNHTPVIYVITKPSFISVAPELKKTFQYYPIFTTIVEFDLSSKLVLKCDAQETVF